MFKYARYIIGLTLLYATSSISSASDYTSQTHPEDKESEKVQQYIQTWARENNVGSDIVYFYAYQNAAQTISDSTWTKIQFGLEVQDTCDCYDSVTDHRFLIRKTGLYLFVGSVNFPALPGTDRVLCSIFVNEDGDGSPGSFQSEFRGMDTSTGAGTYQGCTATAFVYLNENDYVEFYANQISGGNEGTNGDHTVFFQGGRVR